MLEIQTRKENNISILHLEGTLDLDGSQQLKETIQQERKNGAMKILLNFSGVSSVMSTHLQNLLTPIRALTMIKGTVAICGMSQSVQKVVEKGMFYQLAKIYKTEEEALEDLNLIERQL